MQTNQSTQDDTQTPPTLELTLTPLYISQESTETLPSGNNETDPMDIVSNDDETPPEAYLSPDENAPVIVVLRDIEKELFWEYLDNVMPTVIRKCRTQNSLFGGGILLELLFRNNLYFNEHLHLFYAEPACRSCFISLAIIARYLDIHRQEFCSETCKIIWDNELDPTEPDDRNSIIENRKLDDSCSDD